MTHYKSHRAKFLITGTNGFVGKPLCVELLQSGHAVCAAVRAAGSLNENIEVAVVGSIDGETDWSAALAGVDVIIHLAARVHVMHDDAVDPLEAFRRVNTAGTEHLARSAAASGVKRLVFVSSVKVNGEETFPVSSSLKKSPLAPLFTRKGYAVGYPAAAQRPCLRLSGE